MRRSSCPLIPSTFWVSTSLPSLAVACPLPTQAFSACFTWHHFSICFLSKMGWYFVFAVGAFLISLFVGWNDYFSISVVIRYQMERKYISSFEQAKRVSFFLIQYFIDLFRFCSLVYFYFLFLMVVLNLIFIFFQVCEILIADFFLMAYLVVKLFIYPFSLLSMLHKLQFHLMCHSIALLY